MTRIDQLRPMIPRFMPSWTNRVLKFHDDHADEIMNARGSQHNHQAWSGGYHDHVVQCLTLAEVQYKLLSGYEATSLPLHQPPRKFDLDFSLESAAMVLYFHDITKIFKYGLRPLMYLDKERQNPDIWYYGLLPAKYQIAFDKQELNALEYVHGEHDYSGEERKMNSLAAFCHCVDVMSARIFFDVSRLGPLAG